MAKPKPASHSLHSWFWGGPKELDKFRQFRIEQVLSKGLFGDYSGIGKGSCIVGRRRQSGPTVGRREGIGC